MDSLILALEEHKSKSKPQPVTSITRIIHLRGKEELGGERRLRRGGCGTQRDLVSLFLLLFADKPSHPPTIPQCDTLGNL